MIIQKMQPLLMRMRNRVYSLTILVEELNEWEQRNMTDAYSWLDRTRRKDILSEAFIRKLHEERFGRGQESIAEPIKTLEWIGRRYRCGSESY